MNIVERIKKLWSQAPDAASHDILSLYHVNPRLDGVRIIAKKCANIDLFLHEKSDYRQNKNNAEIVPEHDIYNLLEDPCPDVRELNGWSIRYFVFACYTLVGEAYLLKIRDAKQNVISLSPMSPSWVTHTPTASERYWIIYPFGTLGGQSIVVPENDVIWFKDINLNDPFGRGKGLAEAIGDEIQSDEYAAKYAKNLFFNDATPSAIIYAPNGNQKTADSIKQTWLQKMAGFHHAKEPMVLTGENVKYEKISQSPTELDFVESRKFLRDVSLQQFHIPPEIVGILESSNRATIDSSFYLLNKNVLVDYLRMYERVMNTQLLWEDFDREKKYILVHENTVEEDLDEKLKIVNEGLARGVLTVNDWRRAMGYEIDEHGGDVYLRSMGTEEINFDSNPVELPEAEEPEPETVPNNGTVDLPENTETEAEKNYRAKHKYLDNKEKRKDIWFKFDARARDVEEPFLKYINKSFDRQCEIIIDAVEYAVDNNKDVVTEAERCYGPKADEALKHSMVKAFIAGLEAGAKHALDIIESGKSFKGIQDDIRRLFNVWIDTHGLELCADINATTKKKLRKALSESIFDGEGLELRKEALIKAVRGLFDDQKKSRAELIARTESCTTMNAGGNELYKMFGFTQKEWISVQDDRTRDSHLVMDGVVVPIEEKFDVPESENAPESWMEYPGDATAPAGQVCNCRCTMVAVV